MRKTGIRILVSFCLGYRNTDKRATEDSSNLNEILNAFISFVMITYILTFKSNGLVMAHIVTYSLSGDTLRMNAA